MGTLTFASLARNANYRSQLSQTTQNGQSKAEPISPVRSQIPTGKVDNRTEQALLWSGLKTQSAKSDSSHSPLFDAQNTFSSPSNTSSYSAPDLELGYSFSSIKKILAYRDSLLERNSEAKTAPAGNDPAEASDAASKEL